MKVGLVNEYEKIQLVCYSHSALFCIGLIEVMSWTAITLKDGKHQHCLLMANLSGRLIRAGDLFLIYS